MFYCLIYQVRFQIKLKKLLLYKTWLIQSSFSNVVDPIKLKQMKLKIKKKKSKPLCLNKNTNQSKFNTATLLLPVALQNKVDKSEEKTKPQTTALSLLTFACDNETHFFWI